MQADERHRRRAIADPMRTELVTDALTAAELTALADHLTPHGLVLEMLASLLPGMYDPSGPGSLLFALFAAVAETERRGRRPARPPACRTSRCAPSSGWGTLLDLHDHLGRRRGERGRPVSQGRP